MFVSVVLFCLLKMFFTIKEILHFLEEIHAEVFLIIVLIVTLLLILLVKYVTRRSYSLQIRTKHNKVKLRIRNNQSQQPLWVTAFIIRNATGFSLKCPAEPTNPDVVSLGRDLAFCEAKIYPRKSGKLELEYRALADSEATLKAAELVVRFQKRRGNNFHAMHYGIVGKPDGGVQVVSAKKVKSDAEYYSV